MPYVSQVSDQANADLQRVRKSTDPVEFSNALNALINLGEALDQVAEILEQRIRRGYYVTTKDLVQLLLRTKRDSLYALEKDKLFGDVWALLDLYKGQYPDKLIESRLSDILHDRESEDDDPRRRYIAEAMRDVGSSEVLPVLEAILYDLSPTPHVKRLIADALFASSGPSLDSLLAGLIASSRASFVGLILEAINAIRDRNSVEATSPSPEGESKSNTEQFVVNAHDELMRATNRVKDDPTYTLVCLRRGAEAMGNHLYRYIGLENGGKPAAKKDAGRVTEDSP